MSVRTVVVTFNQMDFGLNFLAVVVLVLFENFGINCVLKSTNQTVIVQSVGQQGLGFFEGLVGVSVVEDLTPNLRDLVLLGLRQSSFDGLL